MMLAYFWERRCCKKDDPKRVCRQVPSCANTTLKTYNVDGEWAETAGPNQKHFLLHDSGQEADARILVFGAQPSLQLLASADTWFMGGTFAMALRGFLQLYVRVPLSTATVSTVYALLQWKSQDTYKEHLIAIQDYYEMAELYPHPTNILCDFEQAMLRALPAVLGTDKHQRVFLPPHPALLWSAGWLSFHASC